MTDSSGIIKNTHLTKTDANAELIWSKNFGFNYPNLFNITNDTIHIFGQTDSTQCIFNSSLDGDSLYFQEFDLENYSLFNSSGPSGNFFVGAWYDDYRCAKIDKNSGISWIYQYTPAPNETALKSYFTEEDHDRNIYMAETVYVDSTNIDLLITKLDPNGNKLWELRHENEVTPFSHATTSLYIGQESIFVTGLLQEETNTNKSFVLKINKSGTLE